MYLGVLRYEIKALLLLLLLLLLLQLLRGAMFNLFGIANNYTQMLEHCGLQNACPFPRDVACWLREKAVLYGISDRLYRPKMVQRSAARVVLRITSVPAKHDSCVVTTSLVAGEVTSGAMRTPMKPQ